MPEIPGPLRVVIRADASIPMGSGHIMRSLTVADALRRRGIGVNVHDIPVHTQPYCQVLGFAEGDYPEAERYYREAISLPLSGLAEAEQDFEE